MHGLEEKSRILRSQLCLQKIIMHEENSLSYNPEEDPRAAVLESNCCPASLRICTLFQRKRTEEFQGCRRIQIGWDHWELFLMPGSFSKLLPTLFNVAFHSGLVPRLWFKPETQGIPELEATPLLVFGLQCATEGRGVKESVSWGKDNESVPRRRQCGFWRTLQTNSDTWDVEFSNWYCNFRTGFLTTTEAVFASLRAFNYLNNCRSNSQNLKNFMFAKYTFFFASFEQNYSALTKAAVNIGYWSRSRVSFVYRYTKLP